MKTAKRKTAVVLVHGVGVPGDNTFGTGLGKSLLAPTPVIEVEWHTKVDPPFRVTTPKERAEAVRRLCTIK
jgi:hypothetical protein